MATAEDVAAAHYLQQVQASRTAAYRAQALWQAVDSTRIADSWAEMLPYMVQTVSAAQYLAASSANDYVVAALDAQGLDSSGAEVAPRSFAGVAADGRDLAGLLASPVYTALDGIKQGLSVDRAMAGGLNQLVMLASSTVTDAGRVAVGVGVASRSVRTGYVRMLSPPSCSRCAVLAGRFYRWNDGFQRHPQCKCIHIPTSENASGDKRTDPYKYFNSLSTDEQNKYFTKDGAQAIRDGADMGQVVNARRGMSTTAGGSKVTSEGTTRRGYWGGQQATRDRRGSERYGVSNKQRMMPEEIYKRANSREEAIRMLREYGYITPAGQVPAAIRGEGYGFSGGRANRLGYGQSPS